MFSLEPHHEGEPNRGSHDDFSRPAASPPPVTGIYSPRNSLNWQSFDFFPLFSRQISLSNFFLQHFCSLARWLPPATDIIVPRAPLNGNPFKFKMVQWSLKVNNRHSRISEAKLLLYFFYFCAFASQGFLNCFAHPFMRWYRAATAGTWISKAFLSLCVRDTGKVRKIN